MTEAHLAQASLLYNSETVAAVLGFFLGLFGSAASAMISRRREIKQLRVTLVDLLVQHSDCGDVVDRVEKAIDKARVGKVFFISVVVEASFRKLLGRLISIDWQNATIYSEFLAHLDLVDSAYGEMREAFKAWLPIAATYPTYTDVGANDFMPKDLWHRIYIARCTQALHNRIDACEFEKKLLRTFRDSNPNLVDQALVQRDESLKKATLLQTKLKNSAPQLAAPAAAAPNSLPPGNAGSSSLTNPS